MVKGVSRQVIVVQSPDKKLFDQAIFILKEGHAGVSNEALLREAGHLINKPLHRKRVFERLYGPLWALIGAAATGFAWILCALF